MFSKKSLHFEKTAPTKNAYFRPFISQILGWYLVSEYIIGQWIRIRWDFFKFQDFIFFYFSTRETTVHSRYTLILIACQNVEFYKAFRKILVTLIFEPASKFPNPWYPQPRPSLSFTTNNHSLKFVRREQERCKGQLWACVAHYSSPFSDWAR